VSLERKRRQPGLASDGPEFVGRHQLIGLVQDPRFTSISSSVREKTDEPKRGQKNRIACLAFDIHGALGKYRGRVKKRPVMLAAIETMAKAHPVWVSRCYAIRTLPHRQPPVNRSILVLLQNRLIELL
jgi:hypothetical protein